MVSTRTKRPTGGTAASQGLKHDAAEIEQQRYHFSWRRQALRHSIA